MITYTRNAKQTIPSTSVKIIGLGGAGANMLDRVALDGMEGAELLALNTDLRTLTNSVATDRIQLGKNLTKGLGAGGDPELGTQAVLEAEDEIRAALRGKRIVFLCVGLGGGTGSGAAPIVTRIAREEGAFVVVFATMPFEFEGRRRREQAEAALNELTVLSNALVTFDNNRMGELVLAKQGIHEAFGAADFMICESIKAVIRLVIRPGLINVGLDDLMSALRTTRSRCLFGSGLAEGADRASRALQNALASPLLDQGALLKDAQTVLVHLCGGENLTLFEIELLMRGLQKFVPEKAHVLFGAAVDPAMGESLSITLISALPEDRLAKSPRVETPGAPGKSSDHFEPSDGFTEPREPQRKSAAEPAAPSTAAAAPDEDVEEEDDSFGFTADAPAKDAAASKPAEAEPVAAPDPAVAVAEHHSLDIAEMKPLEFSKRSEPTAKEHAKASEEDPDGDFGVPVKEVASSKPAAGSKPLWGSAKSTEKPNERIIEADDEDADDEDFAMPAAGSNEEATEPPKLKLGIKPSGPQSELSFESAPRGKFEGADRNVVDGEDLDLPPFLRRKK